MGGDSLLDTAAAPVDVAGSRVLLDVPAPGESLKKSIDNFFLNQVFGAFCLNVLADIFCKLFYLLIGYLALLRCRRFREKEEKLKLLEIEKLLDSRSARDKEELETLLQKGGFIRRVPHAASAHRASASGKPPVSSSNTPPTDQSQKGKGEASSDLPKGRNGFVCGHDPDPSSAAQSSTSQIARTVAESPMSGNDTHVIDILTTFHFPDSEASTAEGRTGDLFKPLVKDKVGVSCGHEVYSSRMLQAMVPATDENLVALSELAVEGMKLDNGFTLQCGGSFLFCCDGNPEEPVLLSLRDVEVPTVLQADYSAGVLTIRGKHLEGAEIRAATVDGYMILTCTKQDEINNNSAPERRIEVWRCTDLLPPVNLKQVKICASKKVLIDRRDVTVRSEVASIQNITLRTVIRSWVPTFVSVLFLARQAWDLLASLLDLVVDPLHQTWLLYPLLAVAFYTIQLLPLSLEDSIGGIVERLKLAILSVQVLPDIFSAPAFFMRNGYCFRRGAKYLVDGRVIFGGLHQKGSVDPKIGCDPKRIYDPERGLDPPEEIDQQREILGQQGEMPNSSTSDGISSRSRDWKWTCFKEDKEGTIRRFDPDSTEQKEEKSHGFMDPFTVRYKPISSIKILMEKHGSPTQFIPEDTSVKLYSKHLQAVTRKLLPDKVQLYEKYGEIMAKYLLVLYIKQDLEKESDALLTSNYDENEGECLDMFHLIRFLRIEYAEIITQYERMKDAGVASFDMLWTLIWPKADVVYYCDISNQELCGKVVSSLYDTEKRESGKTGKYEFRVLLEVYGYDSESMSSKVKKVESAVSSFLEEVEISKLDVFPLQFKANPSTAEEFFLTRGRRYFDLTLKYERRFMHYQGPLYQGRSASDLRWRRAWASEDRHKETDIDGRVMIDPRAWVEMNKSVKRNTRSGPPLQTECVMYEFNPLLKYAPAIVYGYSFSSRMWGCFVIDRFSNIQFISTAFDTLVMNEDIKSLLLAMTKRYIQHPQAGEHSLTNVDPLPNKGKGCIILLHGAPGTGKTFTVESLAEKLECPLWQLSVDSTSSTADLESDLLKTFKIAASWQAILVLDEADVYLAARQYSSFSSNVTEPNARTGVFLRVLEYYTGILFLTTNEYFNIDPAIKSRMSLVVKYEEFNIHDRKQLWINFLKRIGFKHPSEEFWNEVLDERFNGREIRNIIQNAQILAHSKGDPLSETQLSKAFRVMASPNVTSEVIGCEEKLDHDPTQVSTTISTYTQSVVTGD